MKINATKKTGFVSEDSVIIIYDENGEIFYYKKNLAEAIYFNLPEGSYTTENKLYYAPAPRYYKPKNMPEPDTFIKQPAKMDFEYCVNPNKCSVDLERGKIYMDNSYRRAPQVVTDFIIGHELHHYKYSGKGEASEVSCDDGSFNMLIDVGYNPAQIAWAQDHTLTKTYKNKKRRDSMSNNVKNAY